MVDGISKDEKENGLEHIEHCRLDCRLFEHNDGKGEKKNWTTLLDMIATVYCCYLSSFIIALMMRVGGRCVCHKKLSLQFLI